MDTKTKHTPGPWAITDQVKDTGNLKVTSERGLICIVGNGERNRQVIFNANAQIIAAAPEMLNCIEILIHSIKSETEPHGRMVDAIKYAEALIVKAKGE